MQLSDLADGIIVSCQAPDESPLRNTDMMVAMALAAEQGGARGIRAQGVEDVRAIAAAVSLPIIGLKKAPPLVPERVYITPSLAQAAELIEAGAHVVALDATPRARDSNEDLATIIKGIHALGALVMADIDSVASAVYAQDCGADVVGTTLVGYTTESAADATDAINLSVLRAVVDAVTVPVIAEGRIWTADDAAAAYAAGASGVVVGTAITNPLALTKRFVNKVAG